MKLKVLLAFALIFGLVLLGCEGPAGPQGAQGDKGITGEKGIDGLKGPQGEDGPQGETGEAGPEGPEGPDGENGKEGDRGPTGPDGDSVYIKGHLDDVSDLDDLVGGETDGFVDAWMVGGKLYIWTVDTDNPDGYWKESGQIWGPKGPEGPRGDEGEPGKDEGGNAIVTVVFNSDGGTAIEGEKLLAGGKVRRPPNPPTKNFSMDTIRDAQPGLYSLNATYAYTFQGWYHNDVAWDFDTPVHVETLHLTAKWNPPSPIDISGTAGANNLEKALTFAASSNQTFIYLLNENISMAAYTQTNGLRLTIVGVNYPGGGNTPRTIQLTGTGSLFDIGGSTYNNNNTALTLENVQLKGVANNNGQLVNFHFGNSYWGTLTLNKGAAIMNNSINATTLGHRAGGLVLTHANLIMNEGSEVSGNSLSGCSGAGGIYMQGGTFTMNGGEVKNNSCNNVNTSESYPLDSGGIAITYNGNASGNFIMNGGSITNNRTTGTNAGFGQPAGGLIVYCPTFASSDTSTYTRALITLKGGTITGNFRGGSTISSDVFIPRSGYKITTSGGGTSTTYVYRYLHPALTLGGDVNIGTLSLTLDIPTRNTGSSYTYIDDADYPFYFPGISVDNYTGNVAQLIVKKTVPAAGTASTEANASRVLQSSVSATMVDRFNGFLAGTSTGNAVWDINEVRIARTASTRGLLERPILE